MEQDNLPKKEDLVQGLGSTCQKQSEAPTTEKQSEAPTTEKQSEAPTTKLAEPKLPEIEVDNQTYFNMQMAQFDNLIAEAELNVAQLKKQKTQAIIDFNLDQLKKMQQSKTQVTSSFETTKTEEQKS